MEKIDFLARNSKTTFVEPFPFTFFLPFSSAPGWEDRRHFWMLSEHLTYPLSRLELQYWERNKKKWSRQKYARVVLIVMTAGEQTPLNFGSIFLTSYANF